MSLLGVSWGERGRRRAAVAGVSATALASLVVMGGGVPTASASAGPPTSVIVQATDDGLAAAKHSVAEVGGTVTTPLGLINGFSAEVPQGRVAILKAMDGVRAVTPDSMVKLQGYYDPNNDPGAPLSLAKMIGADAFYKAGIFGSGVGVAVIDSGMVFADSLNRVGVYAGPDLTPEVQDANLRNIDTFGHGTAMISLVGGRSSNAQRPYLYDSNAFTGIAPETSVVSVKVADALGNSTQAGIISAIDWCVKNRWNGFNLRVINLSLGADPGSGYLSDPMAAAVERAWASGIVVVAAAGNDGGGQVLMPAADPYVISVGAVDTHGTLSTSDDTVADFSNRGNGTRNPDLVAPGTSIVATRDVGSYIDQTYAAANAPTPTLLKGSGTSQAAAIVSGAAALLLSKLPGLTPDQVKWWLTHSTKPVVNGTPQSAGAGELNLAALATAVYPWWNTTQTWQRNGASYSTSSSISNGYWGPLGRVWVEYSAPAPTVASENVFDWMSARWTSARWTSARWTSARWTTSVWSSSRWASNRWK